LPKLYQEEAKKEWALLLWKLLLDLCIKMILSTFFVINKIF
jgi:hypothetical protein